jgi:hypothetical protein
MQAEIVGLCALISAIGQLSPLAAAAASVLLVLPAYYWRLRAYIAEQRFNEADFDKRRRGENADANIKEEIEEKTG